MCANTFVPFATKTMFPSQFTYNGEEWTAKALCGEGTFSKCFQIHSKSGRNLAIKIYRPGKKYEFAFENEVEVSSLLKSNSDSILVSYIVNYIDTFTFSGGRCILMELLGCNLNELLLKNEMKGLSMYLVKKILHDLISAAIFLKELGIVHGDIKPSNILWNMNSECFQLIDFSISFKSGWESGFYQPLQSPGYQAPEVIEWNRNIEANSCFNPDKDLVVWPDNSIDLWSIACVLVYVFSGQKLYSNECAQQLPLECDNCAANRNQPCLHSVKATNLVHSSRNELQIWDIKQLTFILSGMLQCHPANRFQAGFILSQSILAESEMLERGMKDLLLLPTRILRFVNMFREKNSGDIEDILLDIQEECEKFGEVVSVRTNKRNTTNDYDVYIEYRQAEDCCKAQSALIGRCFDNRCVVATFFPGQHFQTNYFY